MNGIIVIDKPAGITSAEVVRRLKRVVKPARAGHLGTLDPFATGVLPILIGEGTKLAPFLEGGDKRYTGVIRLGVETDTLDCEGSQARTASVPSLTRDILAMAEGRFVGRISQVPPVFSAIKRDGVPLYKLARKGGEVPPPEPREVEIRFLKLEPVATDSLRFEVVCGAGAYIRSLARDIGVTLGTVAHLVELRRLWSSGFSIDDAQELTSVIEAFEAGNRGAVRLIGLVDAVPNLPCATVDAMSEARLRNGDSTALDLAAPAGAGIFKVLNREGRLIAVARATSRATAVIQRVFNE